MELHNLLFTVLFCAVVLIFAYCRGVYVEWIEEEKTWENAPSLLALEYRREKRGDFVRVGYDSEALLPRPYSRIKLHFDKLGEVRTVMAFCETTSSIGGDMENPELEVKREPYLDLILKDRLPRS